MHLIVKSYTQNIDNGFKGSIIYGINNIKCFYSHIVIIICNKFKTNKKSIFAKI